MNTYYLEALKKYAIFSGRASRKEYWMFMLFNFIIAFALGLIEGIVKIKILGILYYLAILIPSLAVLVRRLHDTNKSGWYFFIGFIPLIGPIILIIFLAQDSQISDNQYGPIISASPILSNASPSLPLQTDKKISSRLLLFVIIGFILIFLIILVMGIIFGFGNAYQKTSEEQNNSNISDYTQLTEEKQLERDADLFYAWNMIMVATGSDEDSRILSENGFKSVLKKYNLKNEAGFIDEWKKIELRIGNDPLYYKKVFELADKKYNLSNYGNK